MAKVSGGTSTITSSGNKLIILSDPTLDIEDIAIATIDSTSAYTLGSSDGTTTYSRNSTYNELSTSTFAHYRNISGVKTKVLEFTVTSFDIGEFWINVTTFTQNTQLIITAYGN